MENFRRSDNVEDRRGDDPAIRLAAAASACRAASAPAISASARSSFSGLIGWALGIDPRAADRRRRNDPGRRPKHDIFAGAADTADSAQTGAPTDQIGQFVASDSGRKRRTSGRRFCRRRRASHVRPPKLVLYNGSRARAAAAPRPRWVRSIVRSTRRSISTPRSSATCRRQFGGGGDFAYAYVIAHEIGHHIQDQLGILTQSAGGGANADSQGAGQCAFGAHRIDGRLPGRRLGRECPDKIPRHRPGDVEKAIKTAQAIGDDRLQKARAAMRCRIPSPMARRRSACNG